MLMFIGGFVFGVVCTIALVWLLAIMAAKDMQHYDTYGGTD